MRTRDLLALMVLAAISLVWINYPSARPANALIRASENDHALRLISEYPKALGAFAPAARAGTLNYAQFSLLKMAAEAEADRQAEIAKEQWKNSMLEKGPSGAALVFSDAHLIDVAAALVIGLLVLVALRSVALQR